MLSGVTTETETEKHISEGCALSSGEEKKKRQNTTQHLHELQALFNLLGS